MLELAKRLWPIARSLTGPGVRESLNILREHLPELRVRDVPCGIQVMGWTVPPEWIIRSARLIGPDGEKVCDFADSNLHVVGYSEPVHGSFTLDELRLHLFYETPFPDAIPYVTSYYNRTWGFCLSRQQAERLKDGRYRVEIDSEFRADGRLNYGELVLPGKSEKEVIFTTNICHPSLANNELSGIVVVTELAKRLSRVDKKFTYRFLFLPETIGSIVYKASRSADAHKIVAGCTVACVGQEVEPSFVLGYSGRELPSMVVREMNIGFESWRDARASDERQFCHPSDSWPFVAFRRSVPAEYPEYHTSRDNLSLLSAKALEDSICTLLEFARRLEEREAYTLKFACEPQLSVLGMYPHVSERDAIDRVKQALDVIAACDGICRPSDIAKRLNCSLTDVTRILRRLDNAGLCELL